MDKKQPNTEYMINSLLSQISNASLQVAEQTAVIIEQQQEIDKLSQELGQLKTENKVNKKK